MPEARLVWHGVFDAGLLAVRAEETILEDPDLFVLGSVSGRTMLVRDRSGVEHVALGDGWHRIRLDVVEGSLLAPRPVRLHYLLSGFVGLDKRLLALRQLAALWRKGAFAPALFPREAGTPRRLEALRVGDALADGASQREIAIALYGAERVRTDWKGRSDYLVSRVRRLAAEARHMSDGGWRDLLLR